MFIPCSSSRVVFPSDLHSYTKRRFISPFAPPCSPWLSLLISGVKVGTECCIPPLALPSGAFSWTRSSVGPEPSQIIFFNSTVQGHSIRSSIVWYGSSSSSSNNDSNFFREKRERESQERETESESVCLAFYLIKFDCSIVVVVVVVVVVCGGGCKLKGVSESGCFVL